MTRSRRRAMRSDLPFSQRRSGDVACPGQRRLDCCHWLLGERVVSSACVERHVERVHRDCSAGLAGKRRHRSQEPEWDMTDFRRAAANLLQQLGQLVEGEVLAAADLDYL